MEQLGSHWTDFHEIWYLRIFSKICREMQVSLKSIKNNRYFTWRPTEFLIISRSVLLRMRNVSGESCTENQNTFYLQYYFSKIVSFLRWQMAIWRMRIACWIPKTTNSEYVVLIAVPLQYSGTNALNSSLYIHWLFLNNLEAACLLSGTN
jgi:hypothetical protein